MKEFRKRTLDKLLPSQTADEADEVGDSTNIDCPQYHYHQQAPAPKPSVLGKAMIGAGLLATGVGAPLGAYFVADALSKPPVAIVQPIQPEVKPVEPEIIDNSKTFDWRVGDPIVE